MDKSDILQKLDGEIEEYKTAVRGDSLTDYRKKLNFYAALRSELEIMPLSEPYLQALNDCGSIIITADKTLQGIGNIDKPGYSELAYRFTEDVYHNSRYDLLWARLNKENDEFHKQLLSLPTTKIIAKAYEITLRDDILMLFEEDKFTTRQIDTLLCFEQPLAAIYREWLDTDASHMDMLQDSMENLIKDEIEFLLRHDFVTHGEKPSEDILQWNALYDNQEILPADEAEDCEDLEQ